MRELGVIPIIGDFTKRNPAILSELLKYGRNSVPLNLVYPAGRPADVITLPAVLTPRIVADALRQAGPSKTETGVSRTQ
jgi:thiol:disulfide interchange protein